MTTYDIILAYPGTYDTARNILVNGERLKVDVRNGKRTYKKVWFGSEDEAKEIIKHMNEGEFACPRN